MSCSSYFVFCSPKYVVSSMRYVASALLNYFVFKWCVHFLLYRFILSLILHILVYITQLYKYNANIQLLYIVCTLYNFKVIRTSLLRTLSICFILSSLSPRSIDSFLLSSAEFVNRTLHTSPVSFSSPDPYYYKVRLREMSLIRRHARSPTFVRTRVCKCYSRRPSRLRVV